MSFLLMLHQLFSIRWGLVAFFLVAFTTFGQDPTLHKIDSLEKWIAKNQIKDTVWVNNLINLERLYVRNQSPKKGKLSILIIAEAKKLQFNRGINKGLRFLTYDQADAGLFNQSLLTAFERLKFNESLKDTIEIIDTYNALLYIYSQTNNVPKALEYALLAKKKIKSLPKSNPTWFTLYGNGMISLGNLYVMTNQLNKALETYKEVLEKTKAEKKLKRTELYKILYFESISYSNLSELYGQLKNYNLSAAYAERGLYLIQKHNIAMLLSKPLSALVNSYMVTVKEIATFSHLSRRIFFAEYSIEYSILRPLVLVS